MRTHTRLVSNVWPDCTDLMMGCLTGMRGPWGRGKNDCNNSSSGGREGERERERATSERENLLQAFFFEPLSPWRTQWVKDSYYMPVININLEWTQFMCRKILVFNMARLYYQGQTKT